VTEDEVPSFKTYWDDFDTPDKVGPALEQLKILAEIIRIEALKLLDEEYQLSHLHFPAFEGPLAHAEGTTRGSRGISKNQQQAVTAAVGGSKAPAESEVFGFGDGAHAHAHKMVDLSTPIVINCN
jgi:hypothetical protein